MLSVLGLTIRLVVLDTFIKSINECKYFNIVCKDPKPICDFIVNEIKEAPPSAKQRARFRTLKSSLFLRQTRSPKTQAAL